jgi:Bacterial extracellular solute-binding proteins, family 3
MKIWMGLLLLIFPLAAWSQGNLPLNPSWKDTQRSGKAEVTIYWYDNKPFFYKDTDGSMKGIEFEIFDGFKKYVKDTFNVELHFQWKEMQSFEEIFQQLKTSKESGIFGAAGFSITLARREIINLSPPYMADLVVLVSTEDIPLVVTKDDFKKEFSGATAITIPGTLMEKDLATLSEAEDVPFNMEFVSNSFGFLSAIKNRKKAFGYLSLPVYLMNLSSDVAKVKRQNYFTQIKEGHGIGFPKVSDWDAPINSYFAGHSFKANIENIVSRYIGRDYYLFLGTLTEENEIFLLNKEKEIQQREILLREFEIKDKSTRLSQLISVIVIFSVLLVIILFLYRNQMKNHQLLKKQHAEIEAQAIEIRSINENLEIIVKQRMKDLERKNQSLEEYAFITSHKLRAPLAGIMGLVPLFDRSNLNEENKTILDHLDKSAQNLDIVVRSVMNSIEGGETSPVGEKP